MNSSVLTVLICAIALSGCAVFYGQISNEKEAVPTLAIDLAEGRGNELVLSVQAQPSAVKDATVLEIYRALGDEPELVQQILLDDQTKRELAEGISLIDIPTIGTVEYFATVNSQPEPTATSIKLDWSEPPPTPSDVDANLKLGAVVLNWDGGSGIVIRRNVIDNTAPEEIGIGDGTFFDTSVKPGDVFTYQVSLFRKLGDARHHGALSEPLYVTVPAPE